MNLKQRLRKLTKLWALSNSDNEFEAQRAKSQAEAMQNEYTEFSKPCENTKIMMTNNKIKRDYLLQSEINISNAIKVAFGCITLTKVEVLAKKPELTIMFLGMTDDAESAAWLWDMLYNQLIQQKNKTEKEAKETLSENELEYFSIAWSNSVSEKIIKTFDIKKIPSEVLEHLDKNIKTDSTQKIKRQEPRKRSWKHTQLILKGFDKGAKTKITSPITHNKTSLLS